MRRLHILIGRLKLHEATRDFLKANNADNAGQKFIWQSEFFIS